jgi:hypothetical protein
VDAREFLASVVPWSEDEGSYVTIHWRRPGNKKWPGRSCRTLEDALAVVDEILAANVDADIFFCLSSQKDSTGKRSRANAIGVRALWMDIDVKPDNPDTYNDVPDALLNLLYFCQLVEIPEPSIVIATGGGIHAYWYSDRTLTVDEWQPYADALKAVAKNSSLKLDAGVTSDVSRILRVPGTINYKYDPPRPVRFVPTYCSGKRYDFATTFAGLLGMAPASTTRSATILPFPIASGFSDLPPQQLGQGIVVRELPLLPFEPIKAECGWLREAYETGGENFDEPQWNLTTLIATFLQDGRDYAHKLGNKHPTYDLDKTDERYDRKVRERQQNPAIGWPRCSTIKDTGSTHCATCSHFVKAKSPLNIGYEAIGPDIDNEEMRLLGGRRPPEMRLPDGFCVDEKDRVCAFFPTRVAGKKVNAGRLLLVLLTQIRDPSFQHMEGSFGIAFVASTELGGTVDVFVSSANCRLAKVVAYLAGKFVNVATGKEAAEMAEKFMVSWLDKLRQENKAMRDQGTMGWRYENSARVGFVYGGKFYHENGSEIPLIGSTDDEFRSWYAPQGKIEVWLRAAKLLTDRKRPELDIIISIAFAAPLATFAGTLYGAMLSVWGEPGTSKSTAQQVAAAVWGHPKQTRESLNSTPKSVQRRLGLCRNLPAYWDDVQDERHQLSLFDCMFVTAEGAEGGRLNPDATYKTRLEWQTLMVACSNASFVEYLVKKQKSTTAGMRRVFEIEYNKGEPEPGMINAVFASRAFQDLEHNFGNIGVEYAKMLASEHKEISVLVGETINRFSQRVQGIGDESYWWGICGVLIAGATLANRLGAELDVEAMEEFLVQTFLHNRTIRSVEGTEGGSYENTEQTLTAFLNHFVGSGNVVFVDRMYESRYVKVNEVFPPNEGHPLYVQIARDERKIVISKRAFREFMNKHEIQPRQVFNGLVKFFHAKEVRLTLGAGTVYAQTQELCCEIFVPVGQFEPLQQVIYAHGPPQ